MDNDKHDDCFSVEIGRYFKINMGMVGIYMYIICFFIRLFVEKVGYIVFKQTYDAISFSFFIFIYNIIYN